MSATFQFDLVTLENTVLSQEEVMVTAPGSEGYFGVLAGHTPFVAMLAAGVLTVGEGKLASRYAISGGYAEVFPERTTVLADRVVSWEEIKPETVEAEQQEANKQLEAIVGDDDAQSYWQKRHDFANICLKLHEDYLARDRA